MSKFAQWITFFLFAVTGVATNVSASAESGISADPNGTVTGHVYADDTQKPVRFCTVTLTVINSRSGGSGGTTTTNASGAFALSVLPGEYYLSASQSGYIHVNPNGPIDPGTPPGALAHVFIQVGQITQADVTLQRGATVSGRLTYDDGTAAVGINATAISIGVINSRSALTARADDHGDYRISGIPSGKYTIRVQTSAGGAVVGGSRSVQLPSYLGNTLLFSEAVILELHAGDDHGGADLTIPITGLRALSGFVEADANGRGLSGMMVTLSMKDPNAPPGGIIASTTSFNTYTQADGSFRFDGLPDGEYVLNSPGGTEGPAGGNGHRPPSSSTGSYKSAQIFVTVQNGDSTGSVIGLQAN